MTKDKFGRELHDVVCSDCGSNTQVPFKPDPEKPVYCRDCLPKHKNKGKKFDSKPKEPVTDTPKEEAIEDNQDAGMESETEDM